MSHPWPAETAFRRIDLHVRDQACAFCGEGLYVCCHRKRRLFTLQGPWQLVVRLGHCPDPGCPGHRGTISPREEMAIAPPRLAVGWDVFAWIGHRRYARHWSVPQICAELSDSHAIDLSEDAVEDYVRQYEVMVAARHADLDQMRKAYAQSQSLVLAIDGLQPEKGHETLYVVRELTQKRVWFAEPLLSSTNEEVRRVLTRAGQIVAALGLPVAGWMSDKQEAFVRGIAAEFPGVPHRYCDNHFLRDLAKPVLEQDSHAKVQMRRKVRGLRAIEQAVLREEVKNAVSCGPNQPPIAEQPPLTSPPPAVANGETSTAALTAEVPPRDEEVTGAAGPCGCRTRGGGTISGGPTGLGLLRGRAWDLERRSRRSAPSAWAADGRCTAAGSPVPRAESGSEKRGFTAQQLQRLANCIDRGLEAVEEVQAELRPQVQKVQAVANTLDPAQGSQQDRRRKFEELRQSFSQQKDSFAQHLVKLTTSFLAGLFLGPVNELPRDNLDLERWSRQPKGHERRIHGRRHAGVRLVHRGPTLACALDARLHHLGPFTAAELVPYCTAQPPPSQQAALARHRIMRKARSSKLRPVLLAELEQRYLNLV